jgi:raffinose/stachyose/melibiose transport system permease protein
MQKSFSNRAVIFSLVIPGLVVFVFAVLAPILLSVYYGMTNYTGIGKYSFLGFKNYQDILTDDPVFWKSLFHAVILGLGFILLQHPVAIFFAAMLDRLGGRSEKLFRTVYFIPCVISVVVTSALWVNIYNSDYGFLNKVLEMLGLGFLKQQWLGDPKTALGSMLFIIIWQGFGWAFLIYYAGMKGIPGELHEAARIDGATGFKVYTRIILPLLSPVIKVNVTLAMISALKQMETVFRTTNGGPGDTTQFLANYLYIRAFNNYELGYGSAISVLFVIICLLVTYLFNKYINSDVGEF